MICPTCRKLGVPPSFYCSKECFKTDWPQHKQLHKMLKQAAAANASAKIAAGPVKDSRFDRFRYTGPLRVGMVAPQRSVGAGIPLPDYAMTGVPASEQAERGISKVGIKTEQELNDMREVCRVCAHPYFEINPNCGCVHVDASCYENHLLFACLYLSQDAPTSHPAHEQTQR